MTIPRVLTLRQAAEGVRLVQHPVSELQQLRLERHRLDNIRIAPEQSFTFEMEEDRLEIVVELELGSANEVGLKLGASDSEQTIVGYDAQNQTLFIDRSASGTVDFHPQFACRHEAPLVPEDGRILLHLFIDRCSLEIFANDGIVTMTDLIFPHTGFTEVELFAAGGHAKIVLLEVYDLQSIYADCGEVIAVNG